jgi:exopolysaccharide biosynthesis polyprenyl glycosylphosphotransferase
MAERRFERPRKDREPGRLQVGLASAELESTNGEARREAGSVGGRRFSRPRSLSQLGRSSRPALPLAESGTPASRRRDAFYRRALGCADVAAAALALTLGVVVLGGDRITLPMLAAIPFVVVVGKVVGLYDRDEHLLRKTTLDEAPALFQVSTLYTLLMALGDSVLFQETTPGAPDRLGHEQILGLWALLFASMLTARAIARELVRRLTPPERCLVLGDAAAAKAIDRKFRSARTVDAAVVGRVPLEPGDAGSRGPSVLGELTGLDVVHRHHDVERVVIAPTTADSDQLLGAIRLVKALGVKVSVLPRLFEVVGSSVKFDDVEGLMLLGVPRFGLTKSSRIVKRSLDLVGAGVGLLLLSPLLAVIALAIKLTSSGPVFFRQGRIGRDGEEFQMLKFRTMHQDAEHQKKELLELNEAEGLFKIRDDPRLTRAGRVLRRLSLDELPQLINVLRGEMSLVGPRPLVADDDRRVEGLHRRRLDLPPGMTGIWQVLGSTRIPLKEMVKIDYLYGGNWSLWLDVKILLRTVPHVLGRRGL